MGYAAHTTAIKPFGKRITISSLKDLGLFSPYDISKWCDKNGILPTYLERQKEKIMEVQWVYFAESCWKVKDSRFPAKVIEKFTINGSKDFDEVRKRAEAWMEVTYDSPMKYLHVMRSSFAAPAVDLLLSELETMYRVWNPDPEIRATVTSAASSKFIDTYPIRPRSFESADLKVLT